MMKTCWCAAFVMMMLVPAARAAAPSLVGQPAPTVAIKALDGSDMSVGAARGHWLLITFSDVKSKDEGRLFFRTNAPRFASVDGLVLHNVVVPGGVMLAPKSAISSRIRSDVGKLEAEVRGGLKPAERAAFERATIRWHVDFDRKYTVLFGAPPHHVTLVLVDPAGRVTDVSEADGTTVVERLLSRIRPARR